MTSSGFPSSLSRTEAFRCATRVLERAGIVGARGDARFLCLHVLRLSATDLVLRGDEPIGSHGSDALTDAIRRRLAGEPVARILGEWEFRGLTFALSTGTLVPRPDTETLIDTALRLPTVASPTILDLGTGSGCILIALLSEWPGARGVGIDRAEDALVTARRNAVRHGVGTRAIFARGDWCEAVRGPFDLIVSNPPYIASGVIPTLAEEVRRHDPVAALDGGPDGLAAYRAIIGAVAGQPGLIAPAGALALEIGFDQAEAVSQLASRSGLITGGIDRDLAGHDRVVTLRPPFDVMSAGNKVVR